MKHHVDMNRFQTNCVGAGSGLVGLFPTFSLLSHSCQANTKRCNMTIMCDIGKLGQFDRHPTTSKVHISGRPHTCACITGPGRGRGAHNVVQGEDQNCPLLSLHHRASAPSSDQWPGEGISPPPGSSIAPAQGAPHQLLSSMTVFLINWFL